MLSGKLLRLVTAHLAGRDAAGLLITIDPVDRGADPDAEAGRRLPPRQTLLLHRRNHPLAKIQRIRSRHPCWPPSPASMVNHISRIMGILRRFSLSSSRSSPGADGGDAAEGAVECALWRGYERQA